MSDKALVLAAVAVAVLDGLADARMQQALRRAVAAERAAQDLWRVNRINPADDVLTIGTLVVRLDQSLRGPTPYTAGITLNHLRLAVWAYAENRLKAAA